MKNRIPLNLATLALALLLSLFMFASCTSGAGINNEAVPTEVGAPISQSTSFEEEATSDTHTSVAATPEAAAAYDCEALINIPAKECAALVALYNSTNGAGWSDSSGWLVADDPCTWYGIDCDDRHVAHIGLFYNKLAGTIPPDLGDLRFLRTLNLWGNQLEGPIPSELANLSLLLLLDLSNNQLTGNPPAELGDLTKLQFLTLNGNRLSGSIPSALSKLENLFSLDLSDNQFSGPIPWEMGNMAALSSLRLSRNELSGPIPGTYGTQNSLYEFDLSYNQLSGPVPGSVMGIPGRILWGNQLEGTISGDGIVPTAATFEGVHFTVDPSLNASIWPDVLPAIPVVEGEPIWYSTPEHIRFTFADPLMPPGRLRMGINLAPEAQILVYPLAELAELDPWIRGQIDALQALLAEKGLVPEGDLPLLPNTNAAQVFHTQATYLVADDIQGLRFISQHSQEARPIISGEIFYTFQGITLDGTHYVAAFFPLATTVLSDTIEVDDWEEFNFNYSSYLVETTAVLAGLSSADFKPDLTVLDAMMMSLRVEK